jgi:DNA-binding transcriptional MerR regulator/methylmalonyl-CoA mutase cobalamin-binding subunit
MSLSKNPALNLKAVLQETGIAADTLRAWERRYGLPLPQRTAGGHRLYSQYDIETIKWLIARQAEGLSISRAVDLWNEQLASGTDPLAGVSASTLTSTTSSPMILPANSNLDSLRTQWIAACMVFNEASAEQILNQAFSIFPVESVCIEVLQKGMVEIGTLWYHDNASIQQEHFASNLAMRRLDALLSASPAPSRSQTILVGCPPGEWHTFTLLLLSLFLRRRGLNVIYLGANVPTEQFAETITTVKADLIILIAQTLISAAALQNTAKSLSNQKVPVSFGGRIFKLQQELIDYLPAHYLGDAIETSLEQVEKLLKSRGKVQEAKTPAKEYASALHAFRSTRLQIENELKTLIPPTVNFTDEVNTGAQLLGDNIIAALQFGNMEHVSGEMEWLKVLLEAHQRPPQELEHFMKNYTRAVDKYLDARGTPIKAWLDEQGKYLQGLEAG